MKKIFTLALALFAFVAVNAQYLLNEGFETGLPTGWTTIDADGDGVNWLHSSALSITDNQGHNGSAGFMLSQSYDNNTGALTPNNYLITPAITLTGNATLTYYVCGQDASYAAEHYAVMISTTGSTAADFTTTLLEETISATRTQGAWLERTINLAAYTGQTVYIAFRHYNVTDMFYLNLDDVQIFMQPTTPTIVSNNNVINFGAISYPGNADAQVNVTGYSLTSPISVSATAPFTVSADNTTFGATASIAATGGTLYVRYTPTGAGTDNDVITLSSTGASDVTINVSGSAFDCSNTAIPYSCSFDSQITDCWTIVDANSDASTFAIDLTNGYAYYSYNSNNAANDWLISPVFTFDGNQYATFDYYSRSTSYPERFQVFALGADTVTLTAAVDVTSATPTTQVLDLSNLNGNYSIGIKCISDADEYYFYVDNFNVNEVSGSSVSVDVDTMDFLQLAMNSTSVSWPFVISSINLNEAITVATVAPFEVSLDGTTFATTVTIPANSAFSVNDSVFVRFAPTTAGTFAENVTITTTNTTNTIVVMGESVDCAPGIAALPYTYDFDAGMYPPVCWTVNSEVNFSAIGFDENDNGLVFINADRLVTPEIHTNDAILVSFDYIDYASAQGEVADADFRVGYSTTNADASSFTWVNTVSASGMAAIENYSAVIPAGAKYIAIEVTNLGTYLFWGLFEMPNYFIINNFSLTPITEPTMMLSETALDFGNVSIGNNAVKTVGVQGALLTANIDVTAPANFEVSADGQAYAATAQLPANGGTLYVKYAPTAEGAHTGNVSLTSGATTAAVAVSGNAVDCSTPVTLPFYEGFEAELSGCWDNIDRDGDGYSWIVSSELGSESTHSGDGLLASQSYINNVGALTPNNWLITPTITIPAAGANLSWWVRALDGSYPADYYEVLVAPAGSDNFTSVYTETISTDEWNQRSVLLMNYAGQNIRIAFNHTNCTDNYWMLIDDIAIVEGVGVESHETVVNVYPNPANNVVNINASSEISNIEVVNMAGQSVMIETVNTINAQVNVANLAAGMYFVKVNTANGDNFTKKITIAR